MEAKITEQTQIGDSVERLIINYKKDSKDRKTSLEYFQSRLTKLREADQRFSQNHEEIIILARVERSHAYFIEDYFVEMKSRIDHYCIEFETAIMALKETSKGSMPKAPIRAASGQGPSTSSDTTASQLSMTMLNRKQQALKSSLRRQLHAVTDTTSAHTAQFYDVKSQTIQGLWQQIEEVHHSMYEQVDNPEDMGYDLNDYIELEEAVQNILIDCSTPQVTTTPGHATSMPKISIPKFDGDYMKWPQFCDLFTEMVHKSSISTIEKFWHLKANLQGEAGRLIQHFNITTENYESAWKTLHDRYNNIRTLTSNLLHRITSQPSYHEGMTANNVKSMHDTTKEALLALNNIKVDTSTWDPLLLFLLIKKLDKHTHNLYEQTIKNPRQNQTIEEFLSFLEIHFQSLEAVGRKERHNPQRAVLSIVSTPKDETRCMVCHQSGQTYLRK